MPLYLPSYAVKILENDAHNFSKPKNLKRRNTGIIMKRIIKKRSVKKR